MRERVSRRGLIAAVAASLAGARVAASQQADSTRAGAGTLGDPTLAGRPRAPTSGADNDAAIQAIEKRLKCTCGCTLDIYTCRTTDFTCTFSPELHREVIALHDAGKSADEIVDAFVARYGEQALMAPEPEGFNLAGYVFPGVAVLGIGATLVWALTRRRAEVATAPAAAGAMPAATPAELDELERALADEDR